LGLLRKIYVPKRGLGTRQKKNEVGNYNHKIRREDEKYTIINTTLNLTLNLIQGKVQSQTLNILFDDAQRYENFEEIGDYIWFLSTG